MSEGKIKAKFFKQNKYLVCENHTVITEKHNNFYDITRFSFNNGGFGGLP